MKWLQEYKSALKNVYAEEPLDVYFYRPLAFIIVKIFYKYPVTPNHYSLFAFLSGLASGFYFYQGTPTGYLLGALFFLGYAILDCCDGMVARMKKNGTEFGRIIDGVVDYTVNAIVYITLALGMSKTMTHDSIQPWVLIILAGVSKAVHSITYDHYLTEYLSYENGNGGFLAQEIETVKKKIADSEKEKTSFLRKLGLRVYLGFSSLQAGGQGKAHFDPREYCERNLHSLRMWSAIGPAVHIAMLILAFLFNIPNALFFYAIIFGNLWLVLMFTYQTKINHDLLKARA